MITEADEDAIMDDAAGKQVEAYIDLNGDGKTDILDLQYYAFAENILSMGTDRTASITESISSQAAAVKVNDNNTLVTGDVNDLLTETVYSHSQRLTMLLLRRTIRLR